MGDENALDQLLTLITGGNSAAENGAPSCSDPTTSSTASPISTSSDLVSQENRPLGQALKDELKQCTVKIDPSETSEVELKAFELISQMSATCTPEQPPKVRRKRARRNPVWAFFDLDDNNHAFCQQCQYSTKSAFSTNLKIHLRCHHKESYQKVIEAEALMDKTPKLAKTPIQLPITSLPLGLESSEVVDSAQIDLLNMINSWANINNSGQQESAPGSPASASGQGTKRKRLRRHPVWKYFNDMPDKKVTCAMCDFVTSSAFSTNLKMHLKSHHKAEFVAVMEQEVEQMKKEGVDEEERAGDEMTSGKRRRRTIAEIQESIDKCKRSMNSSQQLNTAMPMLSPTVSEIKDEAKEFIDVSSQLVNLLGEQGLDLSSVLKNAALKELLNSVGTDLLENSAFRNFVQLLDPKYELPLTNGLF